MKQHSGKRDFWMQFVDNYQLRIRALQESGAECVEIWAPDLVMGSLGSLQNLVMRLGLDFREAAVKRFISPDFWHTTDRSAPVHVPVSEV